MVSILLPVLSPGCWESRGRTTGFRAYLTASGITLPLYPGRMFLPFFFLVDSLSAEPGPCQPANNPVQQQRPCRTKQNTGIQTKKKTVQGKKNNDRHAQNTRPEDAFSESHHEHAQSVPEQQEKTGCGLWAVWQREEWKRSIENAMKGV